MIEAILSMSFLRRLQGASESGVNKLVQKFLYLIITVSIFWPHYVVGLGMGIGVIIWLVWNHNFTPPWGAFKRYFVFGLGYPIGWYLRMPCWTCFGELWLGASTGAFLYLIQGLL